VTSENQTGVVIPSCKERDLSFLFAGDIIVGSLDPKASVLRGNTLFLML
jgi:hypothetical protein